MQPKADIKCKAVTQGFDKRGSKCREFLSTRVISVNSCRLTSREFIAITTKDGKMVAEVEYRGAESLVR